MRINVRDRNLRFQTVLGIVFLLCLGSSAFAEKYGFDVWTTANGLPQNTITGIAQANDGYLWLSTFDGLARFDGVRFTIFDKANTPGIHNNRFSGLFIDRWGAMWAKTENGVVTIYRNGEFSSFQTPEDWSSFYNIVSDTDGEALIETLDGFYYFQDGSFVRAPEEKGKNLRPVKFGKSGATWIFRPDGVTRQYGGQLTNYEIRLPVEAFNNFTSLVPFEDNRGALWFATADKLYRLFDGKITVLTQKEIPALKELSLRVIFQDADGSVLLVFDSPTETDKKDGRIVRFTDGQFSAFKIGKFIGATAGITDREGNLWLASTTGLKRLRQQLISSISIKDGLVSNEVYPLLQTTNGDILVGTVKGVNRYSDGKVMSTSLQYSRDFPLYMRGLWEDDSARVWLGFQGGGGFGRFEKPSSVVRIGKRDLPAGATDFAKDREGNVWVATEEGLFKYRDDREIAHYTVNDGLRNDKVVTVHYDGDGTLWLGTFDGLSSFKNGSFNNFTDAENSPKGIVRTIYEDAEGVLWFGTYSDGLVRYKDGRFFSYRIEDGLFNNGVFAILEDNRGNFWMSSNRGIHRVSRQDLSDYADGKIPKLNSISYDEKDGMLNAECNGGRIPAGIKTRDGQLWFATMGGVAIVDPELERFNPVPPPVRIEAIAIDRKAVNLKHEQTEVELLPGQTNLAIEYTGLSLTKSQQTKFKYKLEGLEQNWVDAGTKRTVDYSYLPAGTYTFRLIAANANGVWNNDGTAIKIIVRPFFYQTWWFLTAAVLAVAFIIVLFYRGRVSRLRKIAETKTNFSRQLIDSQEAERKRIATELHDGLGQSLVVIKNRAMLGIKKGDDRERVSKELGIISDSASLALDEVRDITNNLRPQLLDRLGLTKAINSMLKNVSGVIDIKSEVDELDGFFTESEEINVYRIIQESLNNVIKHSKASAAVVLIKCVEGKILITIEDNGDGFDVLTVKNGLGLVGLRERAQLLKGSFSVDSKPGRGTKIQMEIDRKTQ